MSIRFAVRLALASSALLTALTAAPPAVAREESAYRFDIPAQQLGSALNHYGEQAGVNVFAPAELVRGRTSAAVAGHFTAQAALEKLLQGTGFRASRTQEGAISLTEALPRDPAVQAMREEPSDVPTAVVMVTAQRREERLQSVPISISVLDGRELDRSGLVGVTDALRTVPGVVAFGNMQGGGTQISMRGVGPSRPMFNGSNPIAYYVDAVPFGITNVAAVPDVDPFDLQRVEVLRGPQGTLYGASASGGVVRLLTHEADLKDLSAKIRTTGSSTETGGINYRANAAINAPIIEDRFALRATIGYASYSGWIDRRNEPDANTNIYRTSRLKLAAVPTDGLEIGLSAWSARNDAGAPSVADRDLDTGPGMLPEPIQTNFDQYGLRMTYELPWATLTSNTSYFDYFNLGYLDMTHRGLVNRAISTQIESRIVTEEGTLVSNGTGPWSWSAGLFLRSADDDYFQIVRGVNEGNSWTNSSNAYAVFGEIARRLLDGSFEARVGARYFHDDFDYHESFAGTGVPLVAADYVFRSTSPRIALNYFPAENLTLYASYSEGFRSGYAQSGGVLRVQPGFEPVRPDELHNYEIGFKGALFSGTVDVDAAIYYVDWKDVQQTLGVLNPVTRANMSASVNGGSASGPGADLGVTARPTDELSLGATVSWNDLTSDVDIVVNDIVQIPAGARYNYSSEYTAGAFVAYEWPVNGPGLKAAFNLSGSYSSGQMSRNLTATAEPVVKRGEAILEARAGATLTSDRGWSVLLFVENLTNSDPWISPVSDDIWNYHIRPRTIGLQLDYDF